MRHSPPGETLGKHITIQEDMKLVHPYAAGLDIGAEEIWACVPLRSTAEPVQRFGTFTPDLESLKNWLLQHQVNTVATPAPPPGACGEHWRVLDSSV